MLSPHTVAHEQVVNAELAALATRGLNTWPPHRPPVESLVERLRIAEVRIRTPPPVVLCPSLSSPQPPRPALLPPPDIVSLWML